MGSARGSRAVVAGSATTIGLCGKEHRLVFPIGVAGCVRRAAEHRRPAACAPHSHGIAPAKGLHQYCARVGGPRSVVAAPARTRRSASLQSGVDPPVAAATRPCRRDRNIDGTLTEHGSAPPGRRDVAILPGLFSNVLFRQCSVGHSADKISAGTFSIRSTRRLTLPVSLLATTVSPTRLFISACASAAG